jgi:hypothetical protein
MTIFRLIKNGFAIEFTILGEMASVALLADGVPGFDAVTMSIEDARTSARNWLGYGYRWEHEVGPEDEYSDEEIAAIHAEEIAAEEAYVRASENGYLHPQAHAEAMEDLRRHEEEFPNGYCG